MIIYKKNNELCVDGDLKNLQEIREFVISQSINFGFNDSISQNIALSVDEACTNLIKYAFEYNTENKICIKIETNSNEFNVLISDRGNSFNPMVVSSPVMQDYFKNMKPGGLGIHIMRTLMDDITYISSSSENPYNTLKLKKYLV